jgi:hypothetical protein
MMLPSRSSSSGPTTLHSILVPITLVPVKGADGTRRYEARGALNTNPAALVAHGGRGSVYGSCGGPQPVWESPAPGPISFVMPRVRSWGSKRCDILA